MNLSEVIFTDGKIIRYREVTDGLVVYFEHYTGDTIELRFTGNVVYEDCEGVGLDFADSKLSRSGERFLLKLLDDDATCLFKVEFDRGEYR